MIPRRGSDSRIMIPGDSVVVREFIPSAESYIQKVLGIQSGNLIAYWPLNEISGTNADNAEGTAARDGTYTGVTLDSILGPDGVEQAGLWDGVNDLCAIFTASLSSAFNRDEGTLGIWARVLNVGVWTDGAVRHTVFLQRDNSNQTFLTKDNTNNLLEFRYRAGGTTEQINKSGNTTTDWFHMMITWSITDDEVIAYFDGAQEGTPQAIAGTPAANLISKTAIGAFNNPPAVSPWSGYLAHCNIWTVALTASEVLDVATV